MEEAIRRRAATLARIAAGLQAETPWRGTPALWFLTDEVRTPDPARVARALPEGSAVILRHYRSPDRPDLAKALAGIARDKGLTLLIGADAALAKSVGAAGIHLPRWSDAPKIYPPSDYLVSASVHDVAEIERRRTAADVLIVSPMFGTASHDGVPPLGIARLAEFVRTAARPVIALGGITAENIRELKGTGVAGIAAIGAFLAD